MHQLRPGRLWAPVGEVIADFSVFRRSWAGYVRYGNSARVLGQVGSRARWRIGLWLSKSGTRRPGVAVGLVLLGAGHPGAASIHRIAISPRPLAWRERADAGGDKRQ